MHSPSLPPWLSRSVLVLFFALLACSVMLKISYGAYTGCVDIPLAVL